MVAFVTAKAYSWDHDMTTNFLIEFPHIHGMATEVYSASGNALNRRARMDDRRKSRTVLQTDRATFDSVRGKDGSLGKHRPHSPWAIANVDFEANDGTLHSTAEECLKHELKSRFGVESLDELAEKYASPSAGLSQALFEQLVESLKSKGRTAEAAADLLFSDVESINALVDDNPTIFKRGAGGRIFLLSQDS